jgi:gliding motility-associated-like protein
MPGETTQNIDSLAPSILAYTLEITDTNGCLGNIELFINPVTAMNPFMSSVGTICKDDNSGSARIFVTEGTPPFQFQWSTDSSIIIEHDSFSVIESLVPGEYHVKITDDMGCITRDTIEVKSNPSICLTIYKAFSPNDDAVHEFWEIKNINLYPEALVLVYDRNGRQVYRRRNYENAEGQAFGGKDQEGRVLPSGTYYYIIDLENGDDVFKGVLTIVR